MAITNGTLLDGVLMNCGVSIKEIKLDHLNLVESFAFVSVSVTIFQLALNVRF